MLVKNLEGARAALRAGRPADLLGLAECGWLDVKAGVYLLDDDAKALELAKDVAVFANTGTGGMILVGYATRKEQTRRSSMRSAPYAARWQTSIDTQPVLDRGANP